jgi:hypothetical protein
MLMGDLILDVLDLIVEDGTVIVQRVVDYLVHFDRTLETVSLEHESGLEVFQRVFVKALESGQFGNPDFLEEHREILLGNQKRPDGLLLVIDESVGLDCAAHHVEHFADYLTLAV